MYSGEGGGVPAVYVIAGLSCESEGAGGSRATIMLPCPECNDRSDINMNTQTVFVLSFKVKDGMGI